MPTVFQRPVTHKLPFKLALLVLNQPAYKIITTYVSDANKLYTINLNVLLGEKLNSSAV